MVVDDDEDDFFIISDYIKDIDGNQFKIDWCNNYDKAVEHLCKNQHQLYLVDYRLGNKTGLDLLKHAEEQKCEAPIVLLTGKGNKTIDIQAMQFGATDY